MIYIFYLEFSGLFYCSIIKLLSSVPACFLLTLFCVSEIYIITLFRSCQHFFKTFLIFFKIISNALQFRPQSNPKNGFFPARSLLKHFAYGILSLLQKLFLCIFFCFIGYLPSSTVTPLLRLHIPLYLRNHMSYICSAPFLGYDGLSRREALKIFFQGRSDIVTSTKQH